MYRTVQNPIALVQEENTLLGARFMSPTVLIPGKSPSWPPEQVFAGEQAFAQSARLREEVSTAVQSGCSLLTVEPARKTVRLFDELGGVKFDAHDRAAVSCVEAVPFVPESVQATAEVRPEGCRGAPQRQLA